jgi:hypothetical protein
MRSVLIHGLHDERAQQECLYVLMCAGDIPAEPARTAIRLLMPSMDAALRQMAPCRSSAARRQRPCAAPPKTPPA